jgi:hypothetical protein
MRPGTVIPGGEIHSFGGMRWWLNGTGPENAHPGAGWCYNPDCPALSARLACKQFQAFSESLILRFISISVSISGFFIMSDQAMSSRV